MHQNFTLPYIVMNHDVQIEVTSNVMRVLTDIFPPMCTELARFQEGFRVFIHLKLAG